MTPIYMEANNETDRVASPESVPIHRKKYRISSVIRQGFFSFQNNPKVLDPSCKTDLELWHCLGRVELVL